MIRILLASLFLFSGCAECSTASMCSREEIALGEENYSVNQQMEGGRFTTLPELTAYIERVGKKVAQESDRPNLPYEFVILNNSEINAWSLPGGKIAINRGMLQELHSASELAAVLGHEIAHSARGHIAKDADRSLLMSAALFTLEELAPPLISTGANIGGEMLSLKYSRSDEFEADKYGIKYMAKAGYDPKGAISLQETFLQLTEKRDPSVFSQVFDTHPSYQDRLKANIKTASRYQDGFEGREEYAQVMHPLFQTKEAYSLLDEGFMALEEGQKKRALECAERGLAIQPNEAHLYHLKASALHKMKRLEEAKAALDQAISLEPNYYAFYLDRGKILQKLHYTAAAKQDFKKSQQLLPSA